MTKIEEQLDPFEAVRRADDPWHERVELHKSVRNELLGVVEKEPEIRISDAAEEWAPEAEPQVPSLSLEQRLENIEGFLGPRIAHAKESERFDRHARLVEQAHAMDPRDLAALVDASTRQAVAERLGVVEQPPTMAQVLESGEEIAAAHLGDRWPEVRDQVFENFG